MQKFAKCGGNRYSFIEDTSNAKAIRDEKGLLDYFIPFLIIEEDANMPDIYGFDTSRSPIGISVFCDHAIVMEWKTEDEFIEWVEDWMSKNSK